MKLYLSQMWIPYQPASCELVDRLTHKRIIHFDDAGCHIMACSGGQHKNLSPVVLVLQKAFF